MNQTVAAQVEKTRERTEWKQRLIVVSLLIVLTSMATLPFFVIGEDQKKGCCGGAMPVTHDAWMHFNQMRSFDRGLASGRIYPRWDDETHDGYGAPATSFYPPGTYYITSAVYFLTRDWRWVWVSFFWLASFGSAAAIYWYARQTMSRAAGLMAAAVYVFAPYHLINQYQRGAMAEFLGFVWAPLVLLFAERLLGESFWRKTLLNAAGLAASFSAFLWSHPPTAYQFLLVFGFCFAIWAIRRGEWRKLVVIGGALLLGSMLAAAYFYPAILEQHLINADDVERTWPYHTSYVYDFGQARYDQANSAFFVRIDRIWAFNLIAILVAAAALFIVRRRSGRVWLWTSAGLLSCFLMTKYSAPIGRLIPKIEIGVFSWRMLALASLSVALLAGEVCSPAFRRKRLDDRTIPPEGGTTNSFSLLILLGALAMSAWYVVWPMWR
ncbi:MAG: 6-pyruvoyl-tetrahydropterin synthase-related protein, partial [Blastocatellia bacterium]